MLAEYDENGSLTTLYTRGDELISQERNGVKSYYLYDGFDSVRMLTDEGGSVTDTYTFDAFGNLTIGTRHREQLSLPWRAVRQLYGLVLPPSQRH